MDHLVLYLVLINAAGFVLMLTDKYKAQNKLYKTPEAVLLLHCGILYLLLPYLA